MIKKIIVAAKAGYCFGVKRAVDMAEQVAKEKKGKVASAGPLIHNPQAVARLEKQGLNVVNGPEELTAGQAMVIRSHGTTPEVIRLAQEKNIEVIDATCPFVKRAQDVAKQLYEEGRQVVICGDPNHAEVVGLNARTNYTAICLQSKAEAEALPKLGKIGIVCQTTQKKKLLKDVVEVLVDKSISIKIENTICSDTGNKQEEIKKIAKQVDVMIIVGGKHSSNTTKLAQLAREQGTRTYHIETPDELEKRWFEKINIVGVGAGASTPPWLIEETVKAIEQLS